MALTTANGMTIADDTNSPPNGPALAQALGNQVDEFYGKSVASQDALPGAGKFPGQRVWLIDVKGWAVWDGSKWLTDTGWIAPTSLASSWVARVDGAGEYAPASYCRRDGTVYLRGEVKGGITSSPIFTLPAGFRMAKTREFTVKAGIGTANVLIPPGGQVTIQTYAGGGSNDAVSLDQIIFRAEA